MIFIKSVGDTVQARVDNQGWETMPSGKYNMRISDDRSTIFLRAAGSYLFEIDNYLISDILNSDSGDVPFNADTLEAYLIGKNFFKSGTSGSDPSAVIAEKFGFFDYNDLATQSTSIDLLDTVWTDITNDGAGAFTNTTYKPISMTSMLDTNTGYLDFTELTLGSSILVRIDFIVSPQVNNCVLECRYELGNGVGSYVLEVFRQRLDQGSGISYPSLKQSFYIYMGDNNTLDNPGKLQTRLVGSDGALINNGVAIEVRKQ